MSIQPCRECGEDVSTQASSCPHCGCDHPTEEAARVARGTIMLAVLAGLAAWLILSSCTSVKAFQRPLADQYPATNPDSVAIFEAEDEIPDCHRVLAELEGSGTVFNSREGMEEHMRRKAAEVGANGVLLRGYDTATWGAEAKSGRGLAIRYGPRLCEEDG